MRGGGQPSCGGADLRARAEPAAEVARLKAAPGGDVFGSADLADSLFAAGLADEAALAVAPVTLGAGTPLLRRPLRLELLEARALRRGVALLRYAVGGAGAGPGQVS